MWPFFPVWGIHHDPAWRLMLTPSPYVSLDKKDKIFSIGFELWNAYIEICYSWGDE